MAQTRTTLAVLVRKVQAFGFSVICTDGYETGPVSRGLIVPGDKTDVRVVNGSAYGVGIYLSPHADYSLGYVRDSGGDGGSVKLLVCAALPGVASKGVH
jgi:hypothetical protein